MALDDSPLKELSQSQLLLILEHLSDGVLLFKPSGHVIWCNPVFFDQFPISPQSVVQKKSKVSDLFHGLSDNISALLMTAVEQLEPLTDEVSYKRRGQKHFFTLTVTPIIEDGEVVRMVAVFHDMTQIKRTEKIRRDFVANVSHELRTPLSAINGFAETLLESALEEPALAREFTDIILRHTQRLTSLVQDLLDLSKLESDEPPEFAAFSLDKIIHKVMSLNQHTMTLKNITSDCNINGILPFAWGHLTSIEQVVANLIENAIKYTEESGIIKVHVYERMDNMIQVDVSDTGMGIEPKHIPRLFERFYRVDKARSRQLGGTGLGLSIVKHIVELHGGEIWVDSEFGVGSTFHFTIPVYQPDKHIQAPAETTEGDLQAV